MHHESDIFVKLIINNFLSMFSQKIVDNYRSQSAEQRVNRVATNLLIPHHKTKPTGNIYTITHNTSTTSLKNVPPKSQHDLQKKINALELQLKRKLSDDSIIKNLFKTKTPGQLSHIDFYLKFKQFEDQINTLTQNEKEYVDKIKELEYQLRQQEETHMANVQQINECISLKQSEWESEKVNYKMEINALKENIENNRFLLQELKKKNQQLTLRNKQVVQEINIEKDALNLTIIKLKSEYDATIAQLKKVSSLNQFSVQEKQNMEKELRQLNDHLQAYKDQNQRLEERIEQLQDINKQISQRFNISRKEQQEKYNIHYQKLRKDYQIEIETLIHGHEELMLNERKENLQIKQASSQLAQELNILKSKMNEKVKVLAQMEQKITFLQKKQSEFESERDSMLQNNSKLAREVKQMKFDEKQMIETCQKIKFEMNDIKIVNEKLNKKISELQEQNLVLNNKNLQLKRQVQYSHSYNKLNDKVYNQNYKTLGRIIEINHKLKKQLQAQSQIINKEINEESLTEVVSYLTQILEQYIFMMTNQKKLKQQNARERNIENRQIISVLEQCKNYFNNESAELLLTKYIGILRERKQINTQQNNERIQVYHELIQCLMNLHSLKCYSSDNTNQQIIQKDSLDSTFLIKNVESSRKFARNSMERQSSGKNMRTKLRVQTEPHSVYEMPLRRKLNIDDQDKQNINTVNKVQQITKKDSTKKYLNEIREKLSNKMVDKQKDKQQFRSEVYKKYFRS